MSEFLQGAIDLHIHIGPDFSPRYSNSVELAKEASAKGMKALVFKDHLSPTVHKALLTQMAVPEISTFGGIALNRTVGGLYLRSVLVALKTGGKIIWLPTVDARWCITKAKTGHWIKEYVEKNSLGSGEIEGIFLLDEQGSLLPEVKDIIKCANDYGAILSSGHVSPLECLKVAEYSHSIGYRKFSICHPNTWLDEFTPEILRQLVDLGAYVDLSFGACSPLHGRQDPREIATLARALGFEHCNLITDYGQLEVPSPVEGMRAFCHLMVKCGLKPAEVRQMVGVNPATLLDLK